MTKPAPEHSDDLAAPDGLLVVHGELLASSAWEAVDGIAALGTADADADAGYDWETGFDVIADVPSPAHGPVGGSRTRRTIDP